MSNKQITLQEFFQTHKNLDSNEIILDVRNPDEYAEAHIKGAKNIPVDEVEKHADELKNFKTIYIHCKRGRRAQTAFEKLQGQGLNNLVCVHDAGMDSWLENGYPVER